MAPATWPGIWSPAGATPGRTSEVILSPRNAAQAASLAATYGAHVAPDNQAVAAAAEVIVLATRPPDALAALRGAPSGRSSS